MITRIMGFLLMMVHLSASPALAQAAVRRAVDSFPAGFWLAATLLALGLSIIGSVLLLMLRWNRRTTAARHLAAGPESAPPDRRNESVEELLRSLASHDPEEENSPLMLAKTYGRGRGEVELFAFFDAYKHKSTRARRQWQGLTRASSAQKIRAAKKEGVGRGDIELAINLKRFRSRRSPKGAFT